MQRRLGQPTQVRFPQDLKVRLDKTARKFRVPASELVRRATEGMLPEWEAGSPLIIRQAQETEVAA